MANCLSRSDQKVHLIFQKLCPSGHQGLLFKWFQNEKGSVYRDEFITNSNHQFFPDPKSNVWKTFSFSFFFQWLYDHEIYSFLETSARFLMTKAYKISLFISCKCWHQSSVYIPQKAHSQMQIFMNKRRKDYP